MKFKKELGWSEIIAFFALLVSCAALWIASASNKAYLVYGSGMISATTKKANECKYIISIPVDFHNSGNTAVTFRRFIPSEIPSVMLSKDRKLQKLDEKEYQLYVSDKVVDSKSINEWWRKKGSAQRVHLSSYMFVDELVPPSSIYKTNLVLVTEPYPVNADHAENISFSIIAEFGNGQKIPIGFVTDIEPFESTTCSS